MFECERGCKMSVPCDHVKNGGVGKSFRGDSGGDEIILILDDGDEIRTADERFRRHYEIEDRIIRERAVREAREQKEREEKADWQKRLPSYAVDCARLMYGDGNKLVRVEGWQ